MLDSIPSALIGTPSTTIRAWFIPFTELLPLNVILEPDPIVPELVIFKPATLPIREDAMLLSLIVFISSPETSVTEYPSDFFSLEIPKAVTTTSSRALSETS